MKYPLLFFLSATLFAGSAFAQNDSDIQAAVHKALSTTSFKDVHASVENGIVTLTGSVDLYQIKTDVLLRIGFIHGVRSFRNQIQVATPTVPDRKLQAKLAKESPQGISVHVHDGIVTLGGYVVDQGFVTAMTTVAANMVGVRDIIDKIRVVNPDPAIAGAWPSGVYGWGTGISSSP